MSVILTKKAIKSKPIESGCKFLFDLFPVVHIS